jgi:flavin reductase (DIM6/NTAB) family NADH-FMN oxidoreductase RutF
MKTDVEFLEFMWPMRHFLITCGDVNARANIIAISFCMPVSRTPPLVACAIGRASYSFELIASSGEFIINVPPARLHQQIYYCGFHSGRAVNKFTETELTPLPGRKVHAPIIEQCVAFMECQVRQVIEAGDKSLFIAEVIEAYADEALVHNRNSVELAQGEFPAKVYATRFNQPESARTGASPVVR